MRTKSSSTASISGIQLGPILFGSVIFMTLVWVGIIGVADTMLAELSYVSASIRSFAEHPALLLSAGLAGSFVAVILSSTLFIRSIQVFIALWLFCLSISSAAIPILQPLSLVIRYSMIASLAIAGFYFLLLKLDRAWNFQQKAGLFILLLIGFQLIFNKVDSNALLLIPMQVALFIGIFFGLQGQAAHTDITKRIARSLIWVGGAAVLINALAIPLAREPYSGGRFHSWYPLATGFATTLSLCITPLLWYGIEARKMIVKIPLLILFAGGIALILLSGTRSATLALAASILIITFFLRRSYLIYAVILIGLVGLATLIQSFDPSDLGSAGERLGNIRDTETRYGVWSRAWEYIKENPLIGYGLSANLATMNMRLPIWEQFDSHNAYLGLWLRMGILGVLAHLLIYLVTFYSAAKTLLIFRKNKAEISVLVLFFTLLSNLFIVGFFEENLTSRASLQQAIWAISVVIINLEVRSLYLRRRQAMMEAKTQARQPLPSSSRQKPHSIEIVSKPEVN